MYARNALARLDRSFDGVFRNVHGNGGAFPRGWHGIGIINDQRLAVAHAKREVAALQRPAISRAQYMQDVPLEPLRGLLRRLLARTQALDFALGILGDGIERSEHSACPVDFVHFGAQVLGDALLEFRQQLIRAAVHAVEQSLELLFYLPKRQQVFHGAASSPGRGP